MDAKRVKFKWFGVRFVVIVFLHTFTMDILGFSLDDFLLVVICLCYEANRFIAL